MLEELFAINELPEIRWEHGDDACDCWFQRIGWWTNPYIGKTLEVRLCCIWAKLIELHPELAEFYRLIPAFDNYTVSPRVWETEPHEWNGDYDMPEYLWYRQQASRDGISVDEARERYQHLNPPKKVGNGSNSRPANPDDRGANGGKPAAQARVANPAARTGSSYPTGGLLRG